jgi:hypothetical protein
VQPEFIDLPFFQTSWILATHSKKIDNPPVFSCCRSCTSRHHSFEDLRPDSAISQGGQFQGRTAIKPISSGSGEIHQGKRECFELRRCGATVAPGKYFHPGRLKIPDDPDTIQV